MDTRFWGPSGWLLLHLVAFQAPTRNIHDIRTFFVNLPYVLPCKFCRASLADYYAEDPVPVKAEEYAKWLYRIHNRVNDKLRSQKLLETPNPSWKDIQTRYEGWIQSSCAKNTMIGWDFLFSIAFTTPCKAVRTSPMPNAPPFASLQTPELRNRWGRMSREERVPYLETWWSILPDVLPYEEWTQRWKNSGSKRPNVEEGRRTLTAWLFKMEQGMCTNNNVIHNSYTELCSELKTFASGCNKPRTHKMKTCRAIKQTRRKIFTNRKERLYNLTGGFLQ